MQRPQVYRSNPAGSASWPKHLTPRAKPCTQISTVYPASHTQYLCLEGASHGPPGCPNRPASGPPSAPSASSAPSAPSSPASSAHKMSHRRPCRPQCRSRECRPPMSLPRMSRRQRAPTVFSPKIFLQTHLWPKHFSLTTAGATTTHTHTKFAPTSTFRGVASFFFSCSPPLRVRPPNP